MFRTGGGSNANQSYSNPTFTGTSTFTGPFGYGVGAGGTVTQLVSKSTTVELNKPSGQITTHNAALGNASPVAFTLTNSTIAATDVLVLNHSSGGTAGAYVLNAQAGAGSASISIRNISASNPLTVAIVISFVVIKGSAT